MIDRCNTLIIGGGAAGMAVASKLADQNHKVWILERAEYSPAGASWLALSAWDRAMAEDEDMARLSWAGASLREEIPGAFTPKGAVHLFGRESLKDAARMWIRGIKSEAGVQQLEASDVAKRLPWVKTDGERCAAALWVPPGAAGVADVSRIYSHLRTGFYQRGGRILLGEALVEAQQAGGGWIVQTTKGTLRADTIVNCGGAWADDVARRCNVRRAGLHSTKRAALSAAVEGASEQLWHDSSYVTWHRGSSAAYCNPLPNGRVTISWSGEASWDGEASWGGGEVEPEPWQIAEILGEFEAATTLRLDETRGTSSAWFRTSVPNGRPVIGRAPEADSFIWMSGFGRGGVECALSASAITADLIRDRKDSSWLVDQYGIRADRYAPNRSATAVAIA